MKNNKFFRSIFMFLLLMALVAAGGCSRGEESSQDKKGAFAPDSGNGGIVKSYGAQRGKPAPAFELMDTKGNLWKLSDLKGQVIFINFWATWCPPCREEMPSMQKLYESMPKDSFKMLTILSNDDPNLAESFAKKNGLKFPILIDPGSEIGKAYGITGVPETYIVDKQGILRQKYLGPRDWNSQVAKQMLNDYINS